ncbi:MAG: START domain-containing protein [Bacteriovoracales bacterium]
MKIIFSIFLLSNFAFGATRYWEKIQESDGVTVFKSDIPNSPLVGFKGELVIGASAEKIFGILIDEEHIKEWVKDIKYSKLLENFGDYEGILHEEYHLPWPIKDRDFVFHAGVFRDKEGIVHLTVKSVDIPKVPSTSAIRGKIEGEYRITPLDKNKCRLEVEVLSDPKGAIPKWIVNLYQKSWPHETLLAIVGELSKPYAKEVQLPKMTKIQP